MNTSLLPSPLHPLFVHLPIALTLLVPLVAIGALWAIRRGAAVPRVWGVAVASLGLLVISSWAAVQTGQREEDVVEDVVAESAIETHEEAAKTFLAAAGLILVVSALGLAPHRTAGYARVVATLGALGLVAGGWQVGHSGGNLVYREGAAAAYAGGAGATRAVERGGVVEGGRGATDNKRDDDRRR
jgi:uncharacterized membrane protein